MNAASILSTVRCPRCLAALDVCGTLIDCTGCGQHYPRLGSIPVLFREPDAYLAIIGQQLRDLAAQVEHTARALDSQIRAPDVLSSTRARCEALSRASRQQYSDVAELLTPLLQPVMPQRSAQTTTNTPSLLTNLHYLFRDWGWPRSADDENTRTLAAILRVLGPGPIGRTVVLGAGASRLASDLHQHAGATETMAVDIDALLVAAAGVIVHGGTAHLTEGYADINELAQPATRWALRAEEPVAEGFHLLLADGLHPPFAASAFDTVVTPWFIDAIPSDLRDAIRVACRLLRPDGRWVSIGPLRYASDVPITRRFSREEVFELAERAGLHVSAWEADTRPSLVSPQTGRGKLEWVIAFCARKESAGRETRHAGDPPDWIMFGDLPIPTFAGQQLLAPHDPLSRIVVDAIDGERTLDVITELVAARLARSEFPRRQLREAVRQAVADIHPALRK